VNATDLQVVREHVVGANPSAAFVLSRCSVIGPPGDGCDGADAFVLDRLVRGEPVAVGSGCTAFRS
jgi:hypothetical protein